jgi:hypothetical protein
MRLLLKAKIGLGGGAIAALLSTPTHASAAVNDLPDARASIVVTANTFVDTQGDSISTPPATLPIADSVQALGAETAPSTAAAALAQVIGGDDPVLRVDATALGAPLVVVVTAHAHAFASLSYDFEVVGAPAGPVPVIFSGGNSASEHVGAGDNSASSSATVSIGEPSTRQNIVTESGGDYSVTLMLTPDVPYEVDMSADAQVTAGLTALDEVAFVDPKLKPAAGVVGYSIEYSPNLGVATPEPSTWAMMLLGFAGLGYAGYHTGAAKTRRFLRSLCRLGTVSGRGRRAPSRCALNRRSWRAHDRCTAGQHQPAGRQPTGRRGESGPRQSLRLRRYRAGACRSHVWRL